MKKLLLLTKLIVLGLLAQAQSASFQAYAPNVVEVGEQFSLTFTLNAKPVEFTPPNINNFEILAGPSTSSSTSIEVMNGRVVQSQSYTYTYILAARNEGKFRIEPAEAVVSGAHIRSNPIEIEVVKATSNTTGTGSSTGGTRRATAEDRTNNYLSNDDLFVTIELNSRSVYMGEPIEATIKIYTRVNILGFEDAKFPSFEGFWSQELKSTPNVNFERVNVNGKIYNMGVIRRYLLFPQKPDKIEIDPFELIVVYQERANRSRSLFDEFFGGGFESFRKRLVSKQISVNVKKLPSPEPQSFYGAVGNFKVDASVDKIECKANDAITFRFKVSGSGNIKLIGNPKIEFPSTFDVFEPKISENISLNAATTSGSKTYEYVCIPRAGGRFEIPAITYTFFDTDKNSYVTLKTKPFQFNILADSTSTGNVMIAGYGKEDIKFIGKDISFIKTSSSAFKPLGSFWITSGYYLFFYLLLIAFFAVFTFLFRNYRQRMQNAAFIKTRKASKIAQKRLKRASVILVDNNSTAFYEEIYKALQGYASDKLNIPFASLTIESIRAALMERIIDNDTINEFSQIMETCEYARFAPNAEHSQMTVIYQRTFTLIEKLEDSLKKR